MAESSAIEALRVNGNGNPPPIADIQTSGSRTSITSKGQFSSFRNSVSLSEPGMVLPNVRKDSSRTSIQSGTTTTEESGMSLRVYGCDAVIAPGVQYKSVLVSPSTTALETIKRTLERYGEFADPSQYELCYARIPAEKKKGIFNTLRRSGSKTKVDDHVLRDDEAPVLVTESYVEEPRRFELRVRSNNNNNSNNSNNSSSKELKQQQRKGSKKGSSTSLQSQSSPSRQGSNSSSVAPPATSPMRSPTAGAGGSVSSPSSSNRGSVLVDADDVYGDHVSEHSGLASVPTSPTKATDAATTTTTAQRFNIAASKHSSTASMLATATALDSHQRSLSPSATSAATTVPLSTRTTTTTTTTTTNTSAPLPFMAGIGAMLEAESSTDDHLDDSVATVHSPRMMQLVSEYGTIESEEPSVIMTNLDSSAVVVSNVDAVAAACALAVSPVPPIPTESVPSSPPVVTLESASHLLGESNVDDIDEAATPTPTPSAANVTVFSPSPTSAAINTTATTVVVGGSGVAVVDDVVASNTNLPATPFVINFAQAVDSAVQLDDSFADVAPLPLPTTATTTTTTTTTYPPNTTTAAAIDVDDAAAAVVAAETSLGAIVVGEGEGTEYNLSSLGADNTLSMMDMTAPLPESDSEDTPLAVEALVECVVTDDAVTTTSEEQTFAQPAVAIDVAPTVVVVPVEMEAVKVEEHHVVAPPVVVAAATTASAGVVGSPYSVSKATPAIAVHGGTATIAQVKSIADAVGDSADVGGAVVAPAITSPVVPVVDLTAAVSSTPTLSTESPAQVPPPSPIAAAPVLTTPTPSATSAATFSAITGAGFRRALPLPRASVTFPTTAPTTTTTTTTTTAPPVSTVSTSTAFKPTPATVAHKPASTTSNNTTTATTTTSTTTTSRSEAIEPSTPIKEKSEDVPVVTGIKSVDVRLFELSKKPNSTAATPATVNRNSNDSNDEFGITMGRRMRNLANKVFSDPENTTTATTTTATTTTTSSTTSEVESETSSRGLRTTISSYDTLGVKSVPTATPTIPIPSTSDMGLRTTGVDYGALGRVAPKTTVVVPVPTPQEQGLRSTGVDWRQLESKPRTSVVISQPPPDFADMGLRSTGVNYATLDNKPRYSTTTSSSSSSSYSSSAAVKSSDMGLRSTGISIDALERRTSMPATPRFNNDAPAFSERTLRATGVNLAALESKAKSPTRASAASVETAVSGLRATGVDLKRAGPTYSMPSISSSSTPSSSSSSSSTTDGSAFQRSNTGGSSGGGVSVITEEDEQATTPTPTTTTTTTTTTVEHSGLSPVPASPTSTRSTTTTTTTAPSFALKLRPAGTSTAGSKRLSVILAEAEASTHTAPKRNSIAVSTPSADTGLRSIGVKLDDRDRTKQVDNPPPPRVNRPEKLTFKERMQLFQVKEDV